MPVTVNSPAPNFAENDLNGNLFDLSAHIGEIVVIEFAGLTWCSPCINSAPHVQAAWSDLEGSGIQFVYVSCSDGLDALRAFVANRGLTMPVIHDDDLSIKNLYDISSYPTMVIVDADGIVRSVGSGYATDPETVKSHIFDVVYMRDAADIAMVMDVSGSMDDPAATDPAGTPKIDLLRQTANIITTFLTQQGQPNDRLGFVTFSYDANTIQMGSDTLISIGGNATWINQQIEAISANGCTAMGAGLAVGLDMLGSSAQPRAIILCTDGMQNVNPKVEEVGDHLEIIDSSGYECSGASSVVSPAPGVSIASHNIPVNTIGIGVAETYAALLQQIAINTGGQFQATDEPQNDLDFAYFDHLTNVLSGGSPEIVCHEVGSLTNDCEESSVNFIVNRTARKLTVIVSWFSPNTELAFWLRKPDGQLYSVQENMLRASTYAMVTVRLPLTSVEFDHVGQWSVIVNGEFNGNNLSYHVMALVDDHNTKMVIDLPMKLFAINEKIPILTHIKSKKEILKANDVVFDIASPTTSLVELLSSYNFPRTHKDPHRALADKLRALSKDPRYKNRLIPAHAVQGLLAGNLSAIEDRGTIQTSFQPTKTGLHTIKIVLTVYDELGMPVQRTRRISLFVDAGKVDAKNSTVVSTKMKSKKPSIRLTIIPRSGSNHIFGPGHSNAFSMTVQDKDIPIKIIDDINGVYRITIAENIGPATLKFNGLTLWKGNLKKK